MEESVKKMFQEKKKKSFVSVREKGTKKKIENAHQLLVEILQMNADLLKKPASEGWGLKKKRVSHIAERTRKSPSYISKLIATPRKTSQT